MEVSAYEQRRLQNIRDNERSLQELGLLGPKPLQQPVKRPRPTPRKRIKAEPAMTNEGPQRRSVRLARGGPRPSLAEAKDESWEAERTSKRPKRVIVKKEVPILMTGEHELVTAAPVRQGSRSSKEINAKLSDMDGSFLGKVLSPPPGDGALKAAAMNSIAQSPPRFSKYSGIQPFRNCVVLFVNATPAAEAGKYNNTPFKSVGENEEHWVMPWFAQTRQHAETPVIVRLRNPRENVFLMCRIPAQPYVCCGKLELSKVDLDTCPMRFDWILTQSAKLDKADPWRQVLEYWQD